jgi:uncharacterized NAD-dependent epimerase/dehydratase family protein
MEFLMPVTLQLSVPYLVFLGDVPSTVYAKTALGIVQWAPEKCIAQHRFPDCEIDTGLTDMSIAEAAAAGAKSLVIGSAPVGGAIQDNWIPTLLEAMAAGLDIVSGLHTRLKDYPQLCAAAEQHNVRLVDVRVPPSDLPIGTGEKRTGRRLLAVGTDCAVGKKYTTLAIARALESFDINCDFRATGQTGIMIAGSGMPIDSVVCDFTAGAAETLSPDNDPDHWDIVEGQGSLFTPAYAGVSLGLLHGSQPDAIVVCHDPLREHIVGCPNHPIPSVQTCIDTNLLMARLTNPDVQCVGVSVNTLQVPAAQREALLAQISAETGLPAVDPIIDGVLPIIDRLLTRFPLQTGSSNQDCLNQANPSQAHRKQTKDGEIA